MKLDKLGSGANKHLEGKLRVELITPHMTIGLAEVLTYGSRKYDDNNWLKGIPLSVSYGAAQRHLVRFYGGEDIDPESGLHHLKHAMCNIAMMIHQIESGRNDLDDRSYKGD